MCIDAVKKLTSELPSNTSWYVITCFSVASSFPEQIGKRTSMQTRINNRKGGILLLILDTSSSCLKINELRINSQRFLKYFSKPGFHFCHFFLPPEEKAEFRWQCFVRGNRGSDNFIEHSSVPGFRSGRPVSL